jgi:protein gp37
LPFFLEVPIKQKSIICEPLLEPINLEQYLTPSIKEVVVGGESGKEARVCDFGWVLSLREQCKRKSVAFLFRQTGSHFRKDGKLYKLPRELHASQAKKANIDLT